jgi:hypothetical protein
MRSELSTQPLISGKGTKLALESHGAIPDSAASQRRGMIEEGVASAHNDREVRTLSTQN